MPTDSLIHIAPDVPVELLEYPHGSCVLVLPQSATWLKTSTTGKWIIDSLRAHPRTVEALVRDVAGAYDLPPSRVEPSVVKLVEELVSHGLASVGGAAPVTATPVEVAELPLQEVWLNLTHRCTLACSFCYVPGIGLQAADMPLELARRVVEEAAELGVAHLVLAGGEPTLHPGLLDLLRVARRQGTLRVKLVTNGTRCDDAFVDELLPLVDDLQVSLDAAEESVHDAVRGRGSFARAVKLLEAVRQRWGDRVRGVSFTPLASNLDQLPGLYRLALMLRVNYLHLNRPKLPGREMLGSNGGAADHASPEFFARALAAYDQLLAHVYRDREFAVGLAGRPQVDVDMSFDPASELFSGIKKSRCAAGILTMCVGPDGSCYPCAALCRGQFALASVAEQSLASAARQLREHLLATFHVDREPVCCACTFRYFCGGGCRALTGDVRRRDPACDLLRQRYAQALGHISTMGGIARRRDGDDGSGQARPALRLATGC